MATTTTFLGALASSASSHAPIGALSRLIRNTAARAPWIRTFAQVDVASLADAEQLRLASGRVLAGHEPPPRREPSAPAKSGTATARRAEGGGGNRARPPESPGGGGSSAPREVTV